MSGISFKLHLIKSLEISNESFVDYFQYTPPVVPPRGEVNAADAFDIGNFDDDETKGIKLTEENQAIYKDFDLIVSNRWQQEICCKSDVSERSSIFPYLVRISVLGTT